MSAILLDTHVWVWYINGNAELSNGLKKTINTALHQHEAYIAAISLWEVCMLENKKRLILDMPCLEWINKSLVLTQLNVVPFTPMIAAESCNLPGNFHDDPADRLITATARVEHLVLVTRDERMLAYSRNKHVVTIKA